MRSIQIMLIVSIISGAFWFLNHKGSKQNNQSTINEITATEKITETIKSNPDISNHKETPGNKEAEQISKGPSIEETSTTINGGPSLNAETNIIPIAPEDSHP